MVDAVEFEAANVGDADAGKYEGAAAVAVDADSVRPAWGDVPSAFATDRGLCGTEEEEPVRGELSGVLDDVRGAFGGVLPSGLSFL